MYKVYWDRSWRVPIISDHQPFTVNMFDGGFILDSNRVMAPSLNATPWNETYDALREVYRIRDEYIVKFVRVQFISLTISVSSFKSFL